MGNFFKRTAVVLAATVAMVSFANAGKALDRLRGNMLVLGGELSNSAATSVADIEEVMPRMRKMGLNTVLVPAYWELMEPTEGRFDFTLIDKTIDEARKNGLKVIFLWFGAWKNSMSCYAPLWFKEDTRRFPRAVTHTGKPLEIASVFSENVFRADSTAFTALMSHIADTDRGTVIMMQIENEIGMLEDARDHSAAADALYDADVPERLVSYMRRNKGSLHEKLSVKWAKNGCKTSGNWRQVFGSDIYTDEIFMAYHYAGYVERLAAAARNILDIPLFVNAAMNSRGRKPGEYPSAGPLAHLRDIWKCAAPSLDMLSPDIYDTGFKSWAGQYAMPGNPLFIPESRCCQNSGVRALYSFGEHDAVGFSAFAIDQAPLSDTESLTKCYAMMGELAPLYMRMRGKTKIHGLLFDQDDREQIIEENGVVMTCRHNLTLPWDPRATDGTTWPEGGGIIMCVSPTEYIVAGSGIVIDFKTKAEKLQESGQVLGEDGFVLAGATAENKDTRNGTRPPSGRHGLKRLGIGYVDEVSIDDMGKMRYIRRENGDQSHQGRHVRISVGDYKILHVRLYEY